MKKFINILLILAISVLYLLIIGNYIINNNLYTTISNTFTGKRISSNIITAIYNKVPNISVDKLSDLQEKLGKSPYIDSISKKYIDTMVEDIKTGKPSRVNIDYELDELVSSMSDDFSKLELVKIRQEINNSDINTVYEYSFNKLVSNNNSLSKFILKVYNLTNSYISLFYILLAVFIIILFVINLKQKSRIFGIAFGTLGVVSLVFMIIEKQVLEKKLMLLLNEGNELININIFYILTVVFIVLSVLLLLIHNRVKE